MGRRGVLSEKAFVSHHTAGILTMSTSCVASSMNGKSSLAQCGLVKRDL